jgi:hypothetical protein
MLTLRSKKQTNEMQKSRICKYGIAIFNSRNSFGDKLPENTWAKGMPRNMKKKSAVGYAGRM